MNSKQINQTLDKAFAYSNEIMKEMSDLYRDEEQPYFLHIMLLQCAHGLHHYGFELSDIHELITEELQPK